MQFIQKEIILSPKKRGFHIITEEILKVLSDDMKSLHVGMLNIFLKHIGFTPVGGNYALKL